jgi:hypothetical protein
MLILNPQHVVFGSVVLEKVSLVAVERVGARVIVEWGDGGPHVQFADVVEQRVNVRVVQEVDVVVDAPRPGDLGTLSFVASMSGADAGRRRVSATAVVTGVGYEVGRGAGGAMPRAHRVLNFVLVSSNGAADPVVVTEA